MVAVAAWFACLHLDIAVRAKAEAEVEVEAEYTFGARRKVEAQSYKCADIDTINLRGRAHFPSSYSNASLSTSELAFLSALRLKLK